MSTANSFDDLETGARSRPPVALIAGPTASGKSELAVLLALRLNESGREAVVINADSAQVYRDLAVLSARPDAEEMRGVSHRLFGTWDGSQRCSAADWATAARVEIAAAHRVGAVPIVVGGTGLYIRTLIDGIAPVPPVDPAVRAQVWAMTQAEARAALEREDSEAAARIAPADAARTTRALEVVRSSGRTLASWQHERRGGIGSAVALHPAILMPERAELYARCDRRFAAMIEAGAADEVSALLARNLDPALPVMRAIGVREIAAWQRGEITRDAMLAAGAQATRNYAKRQQTWLRHQPPSFWPRIEQSNVAPDALFARLLLNQALTAHDPVA